jgi:hypothetical protein
MSFHESATDITVEGNILKAQLSNGEEYLEAEFDLDTVIGVSDGALTWGGESRPSPMLLDSHSVTDVCRLLRVLRGHLLWSRG